MIHFRHLDMACRYFIYRMRKLHPFEVQANLLNACNQRCVYCRCPEVKTTLLTTNQWLSTIRQLGHLGTIRIKFQGGEPTLRPDFRELCAEAQKMGMITAAVSHGSSIASQPNLLDYLDELAVSLDSPREETNDRLRGQGAHEGAVKAIDLALQGGLSTFVNMILTRINLSDLDEMLAYCEKRGVMMHAQPVMFDQQSVYGRYFDDTVKNLALTEGQIRSAHRLMAERKRQGHKLIFSGLAYQKAANWQNYSTSTIQSNEESSCMAGKYYIHIEPNGDVHPCGLNESNFKPKNLLKHGLKEAILHASHHNCCDCWMVYMNERKFLFGLAPRALAEVLRRG
jgi:MoaA/NifB/PqqE/SkfB family radical SAM enzyme